MITSYRLVYMKPQNGKSMYTEHVLQKIRDDLTAEDLIEARARGERFLNGEDTEDAEGD